MTDGIDLDSFQCPGPFPGDPKGDYPTLHSWAPLRSGSEIRLSGSVRNHPELPDGEIVTSPLRDIACDRSWCRTFNTLYLLGEQAAEKTAVKAVPDEPLPLLLRLLLAEDWISAAKIARDGTIPHRSLLDLQANSDFGEIWTNADSMPVVEGQRRAAAIVARIADGAMPHSVVAAWQALAAETSSPDTCRPTAAAGSAAYDRWYATHPEGEAAKQLRRNLAGWRELADDDRRTLSNVERDQFKLARTLGEKAISDDNGQNEDAGERHATTLTKSTPATDAVRKPEPSLAQPGLVVIRELGGNTLTVIGREARNEFRKIIGATMPLAETPDLAIARQTLVREFPHCGTAIDAILGDLKGRTIKWRPTLLAGVPGTGKSRLANRIPQVLGLPEPQRFDAAGSSDNVFGGTPRRWSSGEPSIPLEAVRRSGIANPCVILDEADKCGTSRLSGRFSDSVLPFLEATTSRVYPDPYIGPCDLSQVNFLATANNELDLPAPLRDRFRLLRIPEPGPESMPALSGTLLKEIAADRGINPGWATPLSGDEMEITARLWPGGSIRRLRSVLEIIFSRRDQQALRH